MPKMKAWKRFYLSTNSYKVIIRSWFMAHGNPWYGGLGFAHGLDRINLNGSWLSRLAKLRYCSWPPDLTLIRTFK